MSQLFHSVSAGHVNLNTLLQVLTRLKNQQYIFVPTLLDLLPPFLKCYIEECCRRVLSQLIRFQGDLGRLMQISSHRNNSTIGSTR